jgi:hypothetical protein
MQKANRVHGDGVEENGMSDEALSILKRQPDIARMIFS